MAKQSQVKSRRKLMNPVFHLQTKQEEDKLLTDGLIKVVRKTGQLNLSGRSLANVPDRMFTMYNSLPNDAISFDFGKGTGDDEETWWNFKPLNYLDLSSNVLQEIPENIKMFEDLTVLNLQDNNLTSLPVGINNLRKLTKLHLSHNKITHLPEEFYKLTDLQVLSLAYNQLENLSQYFGDLVMLQKLDLSNNCLTELPSGLGYLVRLAEINLSHNKLIELPPDIVNIRGLLKLDITHNELQYLPTFGELRKLQLLFAQHNNIEGLPNFEGCENIQQLHFGNNFIKEIPKEFCEHMSHLKILDLRDNQIENVPDEIAMLQHVIRLDLTNNELTTLPNSLGLLPHLQNLQIEGNKMKQIRMDIIKGGTHRILRHLREKIDEAELETLPNISSQTFIEKKLFPDKYVMRNSRALNVNMKELTHVPDEVFENAKYGEVTIVDLCKNKLHVVPSGLGIISENICELNLSLNQLHEIPEFFCEFVRLKYLDLGSNLLSSLPNSLSSLVNLRELVISNNRFIDIPECVFEMVGLEILLASGNKINAIDVPALKKLKRIATLDLSNNNINHVPPELGCLTQLRNLEIKGNCFRQPRYAILEQGTEAILSYLRDRIPQ